MQYLSEKISFSLLFSNLLSFRLLYNMSFLLERAFINSLKALKSKTCLIRTLTKRSFKNKYKII